MAKISSNRWKSHNKNGFLMISDDVRMSCDFDSYLVPTYIQRTCLRANHRVKGSFFSIFRFISGCKIIFLLWKISFHLILCLYGGLQLEFYRRKIGKHVPVFFSDYCADSLRFQIKSGLFKVLTCYSDSESGKLMTWSWWWCKHCRGGVIGGPFPTFHGKF